MRIASYRQEKPIWLSQAYHPTCSPGTFRLFQVPERRAAVLPTLYPPPNRNSSVFSFTLGSISGSPLDNGLPDSIFNVFSSTLGSISNFSPFSGGPPVISGSSSLNLTFRERTTGRCSSAGERTRLYLSAASIGLDLG